MNKKIHFIDSYCNIVQRFRAYMYMICLIASNPSNYSTIFVDFVARGGGVTGKFCRNNVQ